MRVNFNEAWVKYPRFPVCLTIWPSFPLYYFSVRLWLVSCRVSWPNRNKKRWPYSFIWNVRRERPDRKVLFGNLMRDG